MNVFNFLSFNTLILFIFLSLSTSSVLGADGDSTCSSETASAGDTQIENIANIKYRLQSPPKSNSSSGSDRWVAIELDGALPNNTRNLNVNDLATYNGNSLNLSAAQLKQVNDIYAAVIGASKANDLYGHTTTLPGALALLSTVKDNLSINQRLMLQSMIGKFLGNHYSTSTQSNPNYNALWANDVQNQNANAAGGVCVDIHHILAETAANLGFQAAGTQTLTWLDSRGAGGHDIALYRDPTTGHYYSQNYGVIVDTGAKSEQSALDTATKMLDAVSNVSMVDDAHGHIHAFIPANALFVHQLIDSAAGSDGPAVQARVGNKEEDLNARLKVAGMQVFGLTDRYSDGDGTYQFNAVGIASNETSELRGNPNSSFEERLQSHAAAGILNANVPSYNTYANSPNQLGITNGFVEANFVGTVRFNQTTGHLEANMQDYGIIGSSPQTPSGYVDIGVDQALLQGNVNAGVNRRIDLVNNPSEQRSAPGLRTSYDDVHVLIQTTNNQRKVYLQIGQDIYLMDGVQNMSAVVIKEAVKANFPTKRVGTFSVDGEVAKDISNPSNNAFYDFNAGSSVRASWIARLNSFMDVGADLSRTQGTRNLPIGSIGEISPDMANEYARTDGHVRVVIHF